MSYILPSIIKTFQDIETTELHRLTVQLQRTMAMSNFYLAYIVDFNSIFTNENDDTRARTMLRGCIFNMKNFLPYA